MFIVPTGSSEGIDTCDIAFVVSNTPTTCSCTFVDGTTTRIGAALEDFVDEINAEYDPGLPLLVGPLVLGAQVGYFAGQQVQRVQARPGAPLESIISFASLRSLFVTPAPVATVVALLNATSRCGGGGGASSPFVESLPFTLVASSPAGNNVTQNGPTQYIRIGPPDSTEPAEGDRVFCSTRVFVTDILLGDALSLVIESPFPIPNAGFQCTTNVRVVAGVNDDWTQGPLINRNTSNTFYVQGGPSTLAGTTTLIIDLAWTHLVDGV